MAPCNLTTFINRICERLAICLSDPFRKLSDYCQRITVYPVLQEGKHMLRNLSKNKIFQFSERHLN